MKKIGILIAVVFVINMFSLTLSAAATPLRIDNKHQYSGMSTSYELGYMPKVLRDKVIVVLPLVSDIPLSDNKINVSLQLGDTESSPFVYKSYEKDFYLEENPIDDGSEVISSYLVSFELDLKGDYMNGTYPVALDVSAVTDEGETVEKSYTVYVTITNGQDPDSEDEPEPVYNPEPVIISLESEHEYSGMDKSYSSGYIPKVRNDYAEVVLPLTAHGDISGDISVNVDLGDPSASPFVMANYEKEISRRRQNKKRVYLASFDFKLKEDRVNGVYPVIFTAGAKDYDGKYYEKIFTLYVTISDGKDPNEKPKNIDITIDNQNIYEGMTDSYSSGYLPEVADDKATVILPLLVEGDIEGELKIAPELGDTSGQAFIMSNFEKSITGNYYHVGGKSVFVYLTKFEFPLKKERINGIYPITFAINAKGENGEIHQESSTVYVTIEDGVDSDDDSEAEIVPTPKIIVDGFVTESNPITAGSEFTSSITIKNTSSLESVHNIEVTVTSSDKSIAVMDNTNTFFFKTLESDNTLEFPLQLAAGRDTQPGRYDLSLEISYDDEEAVSHSTSAVVSIDVRQETSIELEMPRIEENLYAGDTLPLTFRIFNMGRSPVYNVRCVMKGPGLFPEGTTYIGTMDAGTEGSADINVFVGSKDMDKDYEGTEKYGFTEGEVTLIYEDETGKEYTQIYDFSTVINAPMDPVQKEEEQPEMAGQWWISMLIGGVIILGGIVYVYIRYGRKGVNHNA